MENTVHARAKSPLRHRAPTDRRSPRRHCAPCLRTSWSRRSSVSPRPGRVSTCSCACARWNANTAWVAEELARFARCAPRDVGYAGLKDRRAVTVQWFSLPRPREALDWSELQAPGVEVLEATPAQPQAAPRRALRQPLHDTAATRRRQGRSTARQPRAATRRDRPRRGAELLRAPALRARWRRTLIARPHESCARSGPGERGFVLSAARSVVFNAVLGTRVAQRHLAEDPRRGSCEP